MSNGQSPAGSTLTARQMRTIMPCFGNFSMLRVEATYDDGIRREHVFDPPYRLRNGEAYAILQTETGAVEIWEVERKAKGVWQWVRPAARDPVAPPVLH